jgi:peptidyl-prolyl cis-trans isomerase D
LISTMRDYFRGLKFVLLIVIAAFIATSVVYFGADAVSRRGVGDHAVASVNGEEIPVERFRRAYASYVEFYRQIYKDRLTPEMTERLGIHQQVINDLIQDTLIGQQAKREGVTATDAEVRARIEQIRAFQDEGHFSRERYLGVLRQVRIEPAEFEADQRRDLVRRKMESLVKDGVKVTPDEVVQAYAFRKERVRAAWASVDVLSLMSTVTVPDADLEPYVKAHQAQFTRSERRKVEMAVVSPKAFAEPVPDSVAEAHYTEHPAEFEKPRRLRAAHVLVRVPPVGGSDAEAKSRAKVEDVIKRARAGEDFAKLARETSEDTATAPQGGDLGFVGPGEMVPQFEQAVFALKKGEISAAPVRTPFGYHAIKVLDVQEGGRAPFKEVAPKIKEKLLTERSERAAAAKAEAVRAPLQAGKEFLDEAKKLGVEARAATVARGDGLEGIGRDAALEDAVFGLSTGGVTSAIKTPGGWVVVKVVEILPAGVPPLAEVKNEVVEAIKRERAGAMAMGKAKNLAAAATREADFVAAAKKEGVTAGETTFFSRSEAPKEKPALPGTVLLAALQTPAGQVAEPVQSPSSVYVVKTLERQTPDPKGLETERDELTKQVLEQKRGRVWESWLMTLNQSAKIEMSGQGAPAPTRR